ncbi:MAG TPA: hypothetical protein VGW58_08910 [Pyrinomonadaceae bacterium]|nr:hypothetical protein [Pyrinomonadaceae bacterium]
MNLSDQVATNLRRLVACCLITTLFLLLSFASDTPTSRSVSAQTRQPVIVFAVSGEGGEGNMDAVALFRGGQFRPPYREGNKQGETTFAKNYFATGKTYPLMFGGGEAGTVTVKKWNEGCNNIHSEVGISGSARLGGQVRALATNSSSIGKRPSSRRAPTEAERDAILKLVRTIYRQRRTPANLLNSIQVTNLTATDIDGDNKPEFVGSFMLTTRGRASAGSEGPIQFERDLFLIAKGDASAVRGDFVKFQAYQPPPEQFLSSIDYVDQLDVDGDGIGEIFTIQGGFDAYAYIIFKKVGGRWREVYQGVGDAC